MILRIDELSVREQIRIVGEVFKQYASQISGNVILSVMPGPLVRIRRL